MIVFELSCGPNKMKWWVGFGPQASSLTHKLMKQSKQVKNQNQNPEASKATLLPGYILNTG